MDQVWKNIVALNLRSVHDKFAAKKSWWWRLSHDPARIESEYRQLLYLSASNPNKPLVSWSKDVDDFWREHLLDTKKYAADCHAIVGRLIRYTPYLPVVTRAHAAAMAETRKLYLASFGESARTRRQAAGEIDSGSDTTIVFSDDGGRTIHSHHHAHHSHPDAGQHASSHGGHAGHSCGGHSSGGHSSCGGHAGCGGHGH